MNKTLLTNKVGIVTTVADAKQHIEQFINYHLNIGVEHIYVFVDDNCEATLAICERKKNVTAIPNDERLHKLWIYTPIYRDYIKRANMHAEVMVRQELNVFVATGFASQDGISWLIHLDIDELFFLNGNTLSTHFNRLTAENKSGMVYLNYEAIPTSENTNTIYTATNHFKINFFRRNHWIFTSEQKHFLSKTPWLNEKYFRYYQNGKSAFSTETSIVVNDVHTIHSNTGSVSFATNRDPIILHFPCVSFDQYLTKYKRLGNFSDLWNGKARAGDYIDTFHLQSRDTLHNSGEKALLDLYRSDILFNEYKIHLLTEKKLCLKLEIPPKLFINSNTSESTPLITKDNRLAQQHIFRQLLGGINLTQKYAITPLAMPQQTIQDCKIVFRSTAAARLWVGKHLRTCIDEHSTTIIKGENECSVRLNQAPILDAEKLETYLVENNNAPINELGLTSNTSGQSLYIYENLKHIGSSSTTTPKLSIGKWIDWTSSMLQEIRKGNLTGISLEAPDSASQYFTYIYQGQIDLIHDKYLESTLIDAIIEKNTNKLNIHLQTYYHNAKLPSYYIDLDEVISSCPKNFDSSKLTQLLSVLPVTLCSNSSPNPLSKLNTNSQLLQRLFRNNPVDIFRLINPENDSLTILKLCSPELDLLFLINFSNQIQAISGLQIIRYKLTGNWSTASDKTITLAQSDFSIAQQESLLLWRKPES